MNIQIASVVIQEGSKLLAEWLKTRPTPIASQKPIIAQKIIEITEPQPIGDKATATPTGCIPCSIGHLGTCSGVLNEAMRFARADGIQSDEVITRVNMCLDELNAMERVDLRPEMVVGLSSWEKELANQALTESRKMRHGLEELSSVDQLEQVAASTQTTRQQIGKAWFKEKLARMTPEDKAEMQKKVMERIEQGIANA